MKKIIVIVLIILIFVSNNIFAQDAKVLIYRYYIVVDNGDDFLKSIKEYSYDKDSYLKFYSKRKIVMKINESINNDFKKFLSGICYINDEQVFRQDVGGKLLELRAKLKTKKKLLDDLNSLFNTSKFHQTLDIEREIGRVIINIESIKGKIQYYKDRISKSEITLFINQKNISKVKKIQGARWVWIKRLGVKKIMTNWNTKY
jgi:uncharacterized protein DUF4349